LCGFEVIFVGANTPQEEIINAIKYSQPKYVAISITNYYNLVTARKVVSRIVDLKERFSFKVIIGGQACEGNLESCLNMDADMILNSFIDIKHLSEGKIDAAT